MEDVDDDAVDEAITDPLERAVALKNKGNKYFKGGRYSQAVKCYSEAIDACPKENKSDLSTFYQNRAAAHEQMVRMRLIGPFLGQRKIVKEVPKHKVFRLP